jgi:hypothetical protein
MSIFFWIALMIVAAKLADGASEMMKARAHSIHRGGDPRELEGLREEVRALSDRLDVTERTAQDAEEKVRFLERLLAAPAPSATAELPRGSGEQTPV